MKVGDLVKLKTGMSIGKCGIVINGCREQRQATLDIVITDGTVLKRIWEKHVEVISEL